VLSISNVARRKESQSTSTSKYFQILLIKVIRSKQLKVIHKYQQVSLNIAKNNIIVKKTHLKGRIA
jgi:hypothetical protein